MLLSDIVHGLLDGFRRDAVLRIVSLLDGATAEGLRDGLPHRIRLTIRVERHMTADVPGRASDGLDEGVARTQKSLLVRIEDADEAHFGKVEAFAQKIDPDEDVDLPCPQ